MTADRCQMCRSTRLVIPNRGRRMCLECSDDEIRREGIQITEIDCHGSPRTYRSTDPATGLPYITPRARRYH